MHDDDTSRDASPEPLAEPGLGRLRQTEIFVRGAAGLRPTVPTEPDMLALAARAAMSPEAWAYVAGGAGLEHTADANRRAFERRRIVPRMLHGQGTRDLSIDLFGHRLPSPLLLAPIGVLEMVNRWADLGVAVAAALAGVPMIFSNQASVPMERCAEVLEKRGVPRWFQLYWSTSDELVASFLRRAEACGCSAIVLTLDTTLLGWRPRDLDLGSLPFLRGQGIAQYTSDPVFRRSLEQPLEGAPTPRPPLRLATLRTAFEQIRRYPGSLAEKLSGKPRAAVQRFLATYSRPQLGWDDLARLREMTRLPILLKGIQHPQDARRAVDLGMDGLVVSNHGGRQVDGAVGALDMLPGVVGEVGGAVPVLFDSGIRSGTDIFKALALGADAVLLGRPYVYGLAAGGVRGVREVIANLLAEFDLTMGLVGCASVEEIRGAELRVDGWDAPT